MMVSPGSVIVAASMLGLIACGPPSDPADPGDLAAKKISSTQGGSADKCPMLPGCYKRTKAMAACKEPTLRFREHSTELDAQSKTLLNNLAAAIKQQPGLTSLLIEGHAGKSEAKSLAESRATAIHVGLVDRGVESGRLSTHSENVSGASNDVTFVVVDCSRTKTADTKSKSPGYWLLLY